MDMIHSAIDDCVWRIRCCIVETEGVRERQEFHVLGKRSPASGIIICTATTVGMNLTRLEHHGWHWDAYGHRHSPVLFRRLARFK